MYEYSMPGCLALLLSSDSGIVATGLERLQALWTLFQTLDAERHSDSEVQSAIHVAWWPRLVYAQELLVMLSEADFKTVPAEVMNLLRKRSDANRKHQLAMRQRWHALVVDRLMEDH
eukprot:490062-Amphidinium_carterae.1